MREIKKILVLAYEYFPMENANTKIVRNLCGLLAESCDVDAVTSAKPGMPGPEYDGKVHVIRVPEYSFHREKCTGKLTPGILARMATAKIRGKLAHDETVPMLSRLYEYGIRKAVRVSDYNAVISFSAPFLTHVCASRLMRGSGTPWIAVNFDPFFSNRIFDPERLEERKKQEESTLAQAARVLITYPTDRDYLRAGVAFSDKITGVEMPGVSPDVQEAATDHEGCRCCFFGSLYREIRNPRRTAELFSAAGDGIEMRFVGRLVDGTEAELFPAGHTCRVTGEKRGAALEEEYREADILVNIGNAVYNQMPSKIFEYISTGKPIVNIYRSPECPTLRYLEKYPLALNIPETDVETNPAESAERVRSFCLEKKGQRVSAEEIARLYRGNTYETLAEKLLEAVSEAVTRRHGEKS